MSTLIKKYQKNIEGKEQFWLMPIKCAVVEFVKGKSNNYHLYFITGGHDDKTFDRAYNSIEEAQQRIMSVMGYSWVMDAKIMKEAI